MLSFFLSSSLSRTAVALVTVVAVSGCAAKPFVVTSEQEGDMHLSCGQLQQEISMAEQYKVAAREEDRFKFRYMMIVPAMISVYNWDKAERAANKRIKSLTEIYQRKGCATQHYQQPAVPYQGGGYMGEQQNFYAPPSGYPAMGQ